MVYPGLFYAVTDGYLEFNKCETQQFDEVIVGVLFNSQKTPLFSTEERVKILKEVTRDIPNVRIKSFEGLSVNFVRECNAQVIIRGLRAITDFEYELSMAQTNRILAPDIDTMFLITSLEYAYLSSTTVKEVAGYNASIDQFVPQIVAEALKKKVYS